MIFITGDIHNFRDYERINHNKILNKLSKDDYLIICGDFGLFLNGEDTFLKIIEKKPYTTLFVDGNHENFDYLNSLDVEIWNGGKVHKISNKIIHLMRGQVFTIENTTFFTFGGAKSVFQNQKDIGITYWPDLEEASNEEMLEGISNLEKHNNSVDYVLTHTCSSLFLPILSSLLTIFLEESKTNLYLEKIQETLNYKHWFFGHFHEDFKLDKKTSLLFYDIIQLKKGDAEE